MWRPRSKFWSWIALFAVLVSTSIAGEKLAFKEQRAIVTPDAKSKAVRAIFKFTNTGNESIRILDVVTRCECVAAHSDCAVYMAGQSGVIYVQFDYKGDVGRRVEQVNIVTDETADSVYHLEVVVGEGGKLHAL